MEGEVLKLYHGRGVDVHQANRVRGGKGIGLKKRRWKQKDKSHRERRTFGMVWRIPSSPTT